jgi:hypothetical protein
MDVDKTVALYFEPYSPPPITLQWPPEDWSPEACSLSSPPLFTWEGAEVFTGYEIQFSLEENFLSVLIHVHVSKKLAQAHMKPSLWKKLLFMPGVSGGTIYWRVIGNTPRDVPSVTSSHSMIVPPPQPVASPAILQTNQDSPPTLSWVNNCNKKFKVRFADNASFTKSYTLSFSLKSPVDNGEPFSKTLTPGQWRAIKARVRNVPGSSIFWFVESCDLLGRCTTSSTMSFVLME